MEEILAFIEGKKQKFAQQPIFLYMQDASIDPRQRLAWIPCAAPFIMGFADLNKYAFRDDLSNDPIQKIINRHTYEDDHHWMWFLEDLKKLGFDQSLTFSDSLRFLWSEETKYARWLTYQLYHHAYAATPLEKLIIIEVTEATGNVMFSIASKVSQELKNKNNTECIYFADLHLSVETGHTTGVANIEEFLTSIDLQEYNNSETFHLIEKIYKYFFDMTDSFFHFVNLQQKKMIIKV
jgi:hypothetical protein